MWPFQTHTKVQQTGRCASVTSTSPHGRQLWASVISSSTRSCLGSFEGNPRLHPITSSLSILVHAPETVGLNWGQFCPQGTFGSVLRHFWLLLGEDELLASVGRGRGAARQPAVHGTAPQQGIAAHFPPQALIVLRPGNRAKSSGLLKTNQATTAITPSSDLKNDDTF